MPTDLGSAENSICGIEVHRRALRLRSLTTEDAAAQSLVVVVMVLEKRANLSMKHSVRDSSEALWRTDLRNALWSGNVSRFPDVIDGNLWEKYEWSYSH